MASELLYDWAPGQTRLALMRDGRLVDLAIARDDLLVGAILVGRVVELAPKLGAAFVDIGQARPGFLQGAKGMTQGQAVLVQVKADAQAEKGATLSQTVLLPGRHLLYQPGRPGLSLPRKLSEDRREALHDRLVALVSEDEGVVVRLHAVNADAQALAADLDQLRAAWAAIGTARAAGRAPVVAWRPDPLERMLADHPGISRVLVGDDLSFAPLRDRFGAIVERHKDGPVFSLYDTEDAVAACLDPVVPLACGGRVVVETTAALTAIDVDSGGASPAEANTQAVTVIARQLRLRNIGGQILVDFVATGGRGAVAKLTASLKQAVASDPTPTHVIGVSALGLVEITRERRGPSLAELMLRPAWSPAPAAAALDALRHWLAQAIRQPGLPPRLAVAPAVAAELDGRPQALADAAERVGNRPTWRIDPACGTTGWHLEDGR